MSATIRLLGPGVAWEMANMSVNWAAVSQCSTSIACRAISGTTLLLPPMERMDSTLKKLISDRIVRGVMRRLFFAGAAAMPLDKPEAQGSREWRSGGASRKRMPQRQAHRRAEPSD